MRQPLSRGRDNSCLVWGGITAYNLPYFVRLEGALDNAALEAAWREVVRRHRVLRTRVVDEWFVFSNVEAHSLAELLHQRRQNAYGLALLAVMTVLIGLLAWIYKRARTAMQYAERANAAVTVSCSARDQTS